MHLNVYLLNISRHIHEITASIHTTLEIAYTSKVKANHYHYP